MKNALPPQLESSWAILLEEEFQKPYMCALRAFLAKERISGVAVYPPPEEVFNAFSLTPIEQVKVVIVGQDPYHGKGQAHGLSFSVQPGVRLPPSLQNIYKELEADVGIPIPNHGSLTAWAKQGVLLLNAALTVREGAPLSHHGQGWEEFTDSVIRHLFLREKPLVFLLWGKFAQQKVERLGLSSERHLILTAAHPSPFSAYQGFFGSRPFSKINQFLLENRQTPINWSL